MKWETESVLLKTVPNSSLPELSGRELLLLDNGSDGMCSNDDTSDASQHQVELEPTTAEDLLASLDKEHLSLLESLALSASGLTSATDNSKVKISKKVNLTGGTPNIYNHSCDNDQEPSDSLYCTPSMPVPDKKTIYTGIFKMPQTPKQTKRSNFGLSTPQTMIPLTPVYHRCLKSNVFRSPAACGVTMSPRTFFQHNPQIHPHTPINRRNDKTIPLTPILHSLCSTSPAAGYFSLDVLSTPALFPRLSKRGDPDLVSILDNDEHSASQMERKMETYKTQQLHDDNVTDFILDVSEDYTDLQLLQRKSVIKTKVERQMFRKGRRGKRVTRELEVLLKEQQRNKAKTSRTKEQKKKKQFKDDLNVETLKRKVKRCGRRTRSMVKACKEMGLASTDDEINDIFESSPIQSEE